MTTEAAQRLLIGVINQAEEDYRAYETLGLIVNGRVTAPAQFRGSLIQHDDCQSLLEFLRPGGAMDRVIMVARLGVRGDAIRDRLGIPSPRVPCRQKP